ncbi:MAG: 2-amino-4-hydroxy-6-hydroxymethyldihydropteridine diphosphokinase [Hormoscilla sp. SP5CHS1]|nr:2-amino-4-hydroxy-6-hydroxymethyldihydropteridine diphosphokinase [Hormoscilla sp. SP12CHS1]MBC6455706.1 2-amino-4-hydroxy-6-hydroxymethyldihydropteridine diphosphokinase [Hormoscilla sp. SP5CHS1]
MNEVIISVGSNIEPEINIEIAREKISEKYKLVKQSQFYRTRPIGFTEQPYFLNRAYLIQTEDSYPTLREKLKQIEIDMGRVKTENKNGPRCIDLDIVVWNREIVDQDFYQRDFIQKTVLELIPDLSCSES